MDQLLQALSAPRRREILGLVRGGERSAGEIHRALGDVTFGAVSQHLGVLEQAGLVSARREGRGRFYAARVEALLPLVDWLDEMWDEALGRLKALAECEAPRRPRPARTRRGSARPRGRRSPRRKR